MIKRGGMIGVIALWCWALCAALPVSVAAGSPMSHWAMSQAGTAMPGRGVVLSNPALVALTSERSFHMAMRLSEKTEGVDQLFAYAEPDNGFAAGVLTWSKQRWATGVDAFSELPLFDESDQWTYVVASSIDAELAAGVAISYHTVESESRMDQARGYRLDLGVARPVHDGFWVGVHVKGLVNGTRWSKGDRTTEPRTVTLGAAWLLNDAMQLALDVISDPEEGSAGVRVGGATRFGSVQLLAGMTTRSGSTHWSAGVAYESGATSLEYAYVQETTAHMAGLSWRF